MSATPTPEEIAAVLAALSSRGDEPETGYAAWRSTRRAALHRVDRTVSRRPVSR